VGFDDPRVGLVQSRSSLAPTPRSIEATMWAAVDNAQRGGSNVVLLTSLGGGAFGNDEGWICGAMARALEMTSNVALDVRIVSHGVPGTALRQVATAFE
jgi:hypothetical protein